MYCEGSRSRFRRGHWNQGERRLFSRVFRRAWSDALRLLPRGLVRDIGTSAAVTYGSDHWCLYHLRLPEKGVFRLRLIASSPASELLSKARRECLVRIAYVCCVGSCAVSLCAGAQFVFIVLAFGPVDVPRGIFL